MSRLEHIKIFYDLLQEAEYAHGGPRKLKDCNGRMNWPTRGVYFFKEVGENRSESGKGLRIVRVGTHALREDSKRTIWNRLANHKGSASSGGGRHRGSIFRLVVGKAIIHKEDLDYPSWGKGSTAGPKITEKEHSLEQKVSQAIGEMPFCWVEVNDPAGPNSDRDLIERNSLSLLSNYHKEPIDPPSSNWLGNHTHDQKIIQSGLWNRDHVFNPYHNHAVYDPAFLDVLEGYVKKMRRLV